MDKPPKKPGKGIRIRTVNYGMIFISCLLYILLISATISASKNYQSLVKTTDEYIACQEYAAQIADGSNYLTEQIRLYVLTLEPEYADAYFTEAYTNKRREKALESLEQYHHSSPEAFEYLQSALNYSNQLMAREIYAIKLAALSQGTDMGKFPLNVQELELNEEDRRLSPEEMTAKARKIIFDDSYQDSKALIASNINFFVSNTIDKTRNEQQVSVAGLRQAMKRQQIFISILFILNLITFIMVIILIVKPLQLYINCIKEEKQLEITGAYEFRYLALTYNDIYEIKASHEALLRHRAEHDPLTGIINRGAFEQMREFFKVNPCPLALLIIDVDKFKLVNDGYGHEAGDQILKKVAALIKDSFRAKDYPARIGGDEFAVIVTEVTQEMKATILDKANRMNEILSHPTDSLPPVSLSIGGAFSSQGFSDDLYSKADQALYLVKEHGRCGCRFYEDGTSDVSE